MHTFSTLARACMHESSWIFFGSHWIHNEPTIKNSWRFKLLLRRDLSFGNHVCCITWNYRSEKEPFFGRTVRTLKNIFSGSHLHGWVPMDEFSETVEKSRFWWLQKKWEQKCIPQIEDIQRENSVRMEFSSHIYGNIQQKAVLSSSASALTQLSRLRLALLLISPTDHPDKKISKLVTHPIWTKLQS